MSSRRPLNTLNEKHESLQTLTVMYDKVLSKMRSAKVVSDIDLYTLYDCVSLILSLHLLNDKSFTTANTNVLRLKHAITIQNIDVIELFFLFFENDKLPKDNINLQGAMDTSEYSEIEKIFFKRSLYTILQLTKRKAVTDNTDIDTSSPESSDEEDSSEVKFKSTRIPRKS